MNKIDTIIENIMYAKLVTEQAHRDELLDEALAAAHELRDLKPVAWASTAIWGELEGFSFYESPLYRLDEVTK